MYAHSQQVMAENFSQVIVTYFADIRGFATKTCDTTHCVGSRTTAHLNSSTKSLVEVQGPIGINKSHRPFDERLLRDEIIISVSDDINKCVANSYNVVNRFRDWLGRHEPLR